MSTETVNFYQPRHKSGSAVTFLIAAHREWGYFFKNSAMEKRSFYQFNQDLHWSTRIFTLMAVLVLLGAFLFNAWGTNWALTVAVVLAVLLLVESIILSVQHHPRTWRAVGWVLLLLLLTMLLVGTVIL